MGPDSSFGAPLFAAAVGLGLSLAIERLAQPPAAWRRPWNAWAYHLATWLIAFGAAVAITGRPWFATAVVVALLLVLVLVNNAKLRALREPFVLPDYEYFTDALRHPRLYIPFLGWGNFIAAAAGVIAAVVVGYLGEAAPAERFVWNGQFGSVVLIVAVGLGLLFAAGRRPLSVSFDPGTDISRLGLIASLWAYAKARGRKPDVRSPFTSSPRVPLSGALPLLVSVQSESFFDPRSLYGGIRRDVLREFDRLGDEAVLRGTLKVPAWGANTVRSEFAFLTGIPASSLGVHRFNPYHAVLSGWRVGSLASRLRDLGYRTICLHPYPASFYCRDRVYPLLGFDEFIDIRAFSDAPRSGPYVGDVALAEAIASRLVQADRPLYVHAVTMENHGPLHLERVEPLDLDRLYDAPPPPGCEDLTIYLRHLSNADRMIALLREAMVKSDRPASLCWFGDHVPIMPAVYDALGTPSGKVDFLIWSSRERGRQCARDLSIHQLAQAWLEPLGLA